MDSKQYTARAKSLLKQAHELHQQVSATMTELGDDAGTAEWQTLYSVMNAVGVACEIMDETLRPHPSVFADEVAPMVCTGCGTPVSYSGGDAARGGVGGTWTHDDELDEAHCDRWNAHETITAKVSAGA